MTDAALFFTVYVKGRADAVKCRRNAEYIRWFSDIIKF